MEDQEHYTLSSFKIKIALIIWSVAKGVAEKKERKTSNNNNNNNNNKKNPLFFTFPSDFYPEIVFVSSYTCEIHVQGQSQLLLTVQPPVPKSMGWEHTEWLN